MKHLRWLLFFILLSDGLFAFGERIRPLFKTFHNTVLVKAELVDKEVCEVCSYNVDYNIKIKVLDDFGCGVSDTITLYSPGICLDFSPMPLYSIYELDNPMREKEFYCDFYVDDDNNKNHSSFFIVVDDKVLGMFTRSQYALGRIGIYTHGIKPARFEKKVSLLLKKNRRKYGETSNK